jgi:hypothetical protein
MALYVSAYIWVYDKKSTKYQMLVTGGSSFKFPSSLQSDEWTPLSPASYQDPSLLNGTSQPTEKSSPATIPISSSNNVSSVIGFWNNKQSN